MLSLNNIIDGGKRIILIVDGESRAIFTWDVSSSVLQIWKTDRRMSELQERVWYEAEKKEIKNLSSNYQFATSQAYIAAYSWLMEIRNK